LPTLWKSLNTCSVTSTGKIWKKNTTSLQFTADLIAMNAAFIISSTYQEIVGTPDSVGQ